MIKFEKFEKKNLGFRKKVFEGNLDYDIEIGP